MTNIETTDIGSIITTPKVAFTYATQDSVRELDQYNSITNTSLNWNHSLSIVGDYHIHQFGNENNLPTIIKDVVQRNYIAPGLLRKKTNLLWGTGPSLYVEDIKDNLKVRTLVNDTEVMDWLESFDYLDYIMKCCEDYQYLQGVSTKFELRRGFNINNGFINSLEQVQPDKVRLASLRNSDNKKATHAIINDYGFHKVYQQSLNKIYPLFDFKKPFAAPNSILYSNLYSFCTDYYSVPEIYGSLEWLNRSTAVPLIFKAMSKNSINLKFHITSPQVFWDNKRKEIQANCTLLNQTYNEDMLLKYQAAFLNEIGKVLSGDSNTGKYMHTSNSLYVEGRDLMEFGWKVEVIDQKVKDFVDAQIAISQRSDHALLGGINIHSALGNISESGKSDSGSEQYYALISYLNTSVDIPEMVIMKAINYAIKFNWPNKKLKLGFFYNLPEKQSDIAPADRAKNNTKNTK
jgi:hypothetical protein